MLINWLNEIIEGFANIVLGVLSILPDTPFDWSLGNGFIGKLLAQANYFIPFASILSIMMHFVLAVAIWYGIRWVLRFVQFIQ